MKYSKKEILKLRGKGFTIRKIQKTLGISSPSVVAFHLNHKSKYESLILPERLPRANDKESEYMCAGFNEYRRILLNKLKQRVAF